MQCPVVILTESAVVSREQRCPEHLVQELVIVFTAAAAAAVTITAEK